MQAVTNISITLVVIVCMSSVYAEQLLLQNRQFLCPSVQIKVNELICVNGAGRGEWLKAKVLPKEMNQCEAGNETVYILLADGLRSQQEYEVCFLMQTMHIFVFTLGSSRFTYKKEGTMERYIGEGCTYIFATIYLTWGCWQGTG